jgi:hypothetical protein
MKIKSKDWWADRRHWDPFTLGDQTIWFNCASESDKKMYDRVYGRYRQKKRTVILHLTKDAKAEGWETIQRCPKCGFCMSELEKDWGTLHVFDQCYLCGTANPKYEKAKEMETQQRAETEAKITAKAKAWAEAGRTSFEISNYGRHTRISWVEPFMDDEPWLL